MVKTYLKSNAKQEFLQRAKTESVSSLIIEYKISKSYAYKILKSNNEQKPIKTCRNSKYRLLNDKVLNYYNLLQKQKKEVLSKDIISYAREQAKKMGLNLKCRHNWLNNLEKKYQLKIEKRSYTKYNKINK